MKGRATLIIAGLLIIAGIVILAVSDAFAVGVALLVIGILALALTAGRGRAKGGEVDH